MKSRRSLAVWAALFATLATPFVTPGASAFAQSPTVTLRATTTLVQVHVVARDVKGRAVTDLKKEDFEVFDDGARQNIAVFATETSAPAQQAAALNAFPDDAVDTTGARTGYSAILLDYMNGPAERARPDAAAMLKRTEPAGKIGLFMVDGVSLKTIADFGSDKQTLLDKIASVTPQKPPPCYTEWSCAWISQTLLVTELEEMADKLSFLPGRKALIWVTTGYSLETAIQHGDTPKLKAEIQRVIQKLNNADVAVYAVDSAGVSSNRSPFIDSLKDYAARTGGALFTGRNDLDACMQEAAEDVRTVYSLAFYPSASGDPGKFHQLKVSVDRPGVALSYRQGYSLEKPGATPAGELTTAVPGSEARALQAQARAVSPVVSALEILARAPTERNAGAEMTLPYFYTAPNVAVVDLAMEIGVENLKTPASPGMLNFVGLALRPDGGVAARFTDTVKAELVADAKRPYHYEHQFRLAPGNYDVRVAFGLGEVLSGKVQAPLTVDGWDGKTLAISGVALARETRKADAANGLDTAAFEGRKALVARSVETIPTGDSRFRRGEPCRAYFEVYAPAPSGANQPKPSAQIRVLDGGTGEPKVDSGVFNVDALAQAGEPAIPVSLRVPVDGLASGKYRLEVKAMRGGETATRVVEFEVE